MANPHFQQPVPYRLYEYTRVPPNELRTEGYDRSDHQKRASVSYSERLKSMQIKGTEYYIWPFT
jgi:hypothetical protein